MNPLKNLIFALALFYGHAVLAQNPIVHNQFTADPTARIFNDKVYLFPSHDIQVPPLKHLRKNWFCMADYHVFSSENLTDWTDEGMILSQSTVPWANPEAYSMWAPDCIGKNGKYYFYFPAIPDSIYGRGFTIGVAVADKPEGPYVPQPRPLKNVHGIDPNVFIDTDGQAYLYWSSGNIFCAKLRDDLLELASEPVVLKELPVKGLKEGPFLFERNGIYYLTYPHVEHQIERLEYAIGNNPLGPFKVMGVIMDESPTGCWTNHHSFINYKNQWFLFYHHNDYSPNFDKNRSTRIDSLFFNTDGTIRKVVPTFRGVGVTRASQTIEIDRYSRISDKGASIAFNDSSHTFAGWKAIFRAKDAWFQYNAVDFGKGNYKTVAVKASAKLGGILQIRLKNVWGPVIATIKILHEAELNVFKARVSNLNAGIENLVVVSKNGNPVEVDWITFK